jgi:general secretion pathway protein E
MGIDAFLLASSLRCVIGQRLVRVLCPHCKESSQPAIKVPSKSPAIADPSRPEAPQEWQAIGCARCYGTGYSDRLVISEVLDVDEDVRELIQPNARTAAIEEMACRKGMTTMVMDGHKKCRDGITTLDEVRRVALDV